MSETLWAFLGTQIFRVPFLFAYIVGVVLAFNRHHVHGRPALLAGWGFGALTIGWLVSAAYVYWQISIMRNEGGIQAVASVAAFAGAASSLLDLLGIVLIMLALFGASKNPAAAPVQ